MTAVLSQFKTPYHDVRAQVTSKVVIAVMASATSAHAIWLHPRSYYGFKVIHGSTASGRFWVTTEMVHKLPFLSLAAGRFGWFQLLPNQSCFWCSSGGHFRSPTLLTVHGALILAVKLVGPSFIKKI